MPSWPLIALMRVVAGVGVGGSIPSVFTLFTEYLPTKDRGFWINTVAWFWMFGSIYTAGLAWICFGLFGVSWRLYAVFCAVPAATGALLTHFLLPESPRFHFLQGDLKACRATLKYMAWWNGSRDFMASGRRLGKPAPRGSLEEVAAARAPSPDGQEHTHQTGTQNAPVAVATVSSAPLMSAGRGGQPAGDDLWLVELDCSDAGEVAVRAWAELPSGSAALQQLRTASTVAGGDLSGAETPSAEEGSTGSASGESDVLLGGGVKTQGGQPSQRNNPSQRSTSTSVLQEAASLLHGSGGAGGGSLCGAMGCAGGASRAGRPAVPHPSCMQQCSTSLAAAKALFLPSLRRTTTLLCITWFGLSFGWYGLNVWLPSLFKEEDIDLDIYVGAFVVTAANLPGNVLAALLVDRMGRKNLMAGSILIAAFTALGLAFANSAASVLILASLLNAVSNGGWNTLDALSTESFPTRLRTGALGVLAACGRLGSIVGQFVFGALIHVSIPLLLGSAACMLLLGAVAGFMLPKETAGAALDDDVAELTAPKRKNTELQSAMVAAQV